MDTLNTEFDRLLAARGLQAHRHMAARRFPGHEGAGRAKCAAPPRGRLVKPVHTSRGGRRAVRVGLGEVTGGGGGGGRVLVRDDEEVREGLTAAILGQHGLGFA